MKNRGIGSTFDSFLEEEGTFEEVDALAQKRVIAWQIEQAMAQQSINKVEMAERMKTSRSQVDRLLDPQNNKLQLETLQRAARAVGASLRLELTGVGSAKSAGHVRERVKTGARRGKATGTKPVPSQPAAKLTGGIDDR
jgi:antitoxin HicB